MENNIENLFLSIRNTIFILIKENHVDVDALVFDLGIDRETFIQNFSKRVSDFTFYLQTLSLVENWEG